MPNPSVGCLLAGWMFGREEVRCFASPSAKLGHLSWCMLFASLLLMYIINRKSVYK